jgi:GT2 family glycosyltransferase
MRMIDLTIVISSYETAELLSDCLVAVEKACLAHPHLHVETIVVDNGSRDWSVEVASQSPIAPRIVALGRNMGFARAVNHGLRIRRGRHVLLLNSDAEIESEVLLRGVQILDARPDVGVLGIGLVHPDGRAQRSVHAFPGLQTELVPEAVLRMLGRRGFAKSVSSVSAEDEISTQSVEAVRGAVFFIRGECLEQVGLLDENYFFFMEETDFCWRAHEAGYCVLYTDEVRAMHRLGASSKRRAPLATRIEFHRSLYRFLDRRRGRGRSAIARTLRLVRNGVTVIGLVFAAIASRGARTRLAERSGLVLWHLRGRPQTPVLADALQVAVEEERA